MKPLEGSIEAEAQADQADATDGSGTQAPGQAGPIADEDGPHDVPDETVIEKTLPTVPVNTGA